MDFLKEISINSIEGFKIGHAQDAEHGTGCSVIICDEKAICGVDIRGGGPASRETNLLDTNMSNDGINALLLSGGSAYGLDAASGVMQYLEEKGKGVQVGDSIVPIVPASCIFDLNCASSHVRPDKTMGYAACVNAEQNLNLQGNVGAGCGATVGKFMGPERSMKSGLGTYAVEICGAKIGAVVIVNAIGDVYEMDSKKELAGLLSYDQTTMVSTENEIFKMIRLTSQPGLNTTIGAVITNAKMDKAQANKLARMASNGIVRTIRPVNTSMDGDSMYAMSVGNVEFNQDLLGSVAALVTAKAINNAVLNSDPAYGLKSAKSFM
ncbi:MAG: P1 family peptidase [Clostridia bacterium]|nr:P1 family peptidase [Clostridia bacterium]